MLPFVLMAQLNSEKLSQGCHSLQYFRLSAKASLVAQSISLTSEFQLQTMKDTRAMATRGGSAQIDFRSKRGYLSQIAAGLGLSVVRGGLIRQEIEELPVSDKSAEQAYVSMDDDRGCFGSLCCKGFGHAATRRAEGVVVV
jgi:hypothetical protein